MWPDGDPRASPSSRRAHRGGALGHDEEPDGRPAAAGRRGGWDERLEELGERYPSAVLSLVAPDGFPFSLRLPIEVDRAARRIRLGSGALGVPVQPGLACLCAHEHDEEFSWQQNFQVRGDLVEEDGGWALVPRKLVGGFELPKGGLRKLEGKLGKGPPLSKGRSPRAARPRVTWRTPDRWSTGAPRDADHSAEERGREV